MKIVEKIILWLLFASSFRGLMKYLVGMKVKNKINNSFTYPDWETYFDILVLVFVLIVVYYKYFRKKKDNKE